ncbi:Nucleoside diphosphate kinase regulator [Pseudomonas syringae pv. tagetis]|uniref:Nucleoside diphosphate kinase regulator n=1 Tax=Pseudomonas syringae pv. tagetis TaxID=129140 RepID=A0A3M3Z146_9PSED|nr:Nucleoside diphosphate kinase regulator [Pseudomonas syringae pv. tagetis]
MFYSWRIKESAQTMTTAPSIILTRLDVQRLESFIDSQDENTPGLNWTVPNKWLATMRCLRAL